MKTGEEVWIVGEDGAKRALHIGGGVCITRDEKGSVDSVRIVHPTRRVTTLDEALDMLRKSQEDCGKRLIEQQIAIAEYLRPEAWTYIKEYP